MCVSCADAHLRWSDGAPGRIRTCDTGFRRAVLYPLSYEGGPGGSLPWARYRSTELTAQTQPLTLIRRPTFAHTLTFGSGGGGM